MHRNCKSFEMGHITNKERQDACEMHEKNQKVEHMNRRCTVSTSIGSIAFNLCKCPLVSGSNILPRKLYTRAKSGMAACVTTEKQK
jgi:hypothetical protein